jgi:hypothetical protein
VRAHGAAAGRGAATSAGAPPGPGGPRISSRVGGVSFFSTPSLHLSPCVFRSPWKLPDIWGMSKEDAKKWIRPLEY